MRAEPQRPSETLMHLKHSGQPNWEIVQGVDVGGRASEKEMDTGCPLLLLTAVHSHTSLTNSTAHA
jgi:hypothetical protein